MRFARSLLHSIAAPLVIVLALLSLVPMPSLAQSAPLGVITDVAGPAADATPALQAGIDTLVDLALDRRITATHREFRSMRDTTEPILQYFDYAHLPAEAQLMAMPFSQLAHAMVMGDNCVESGTVTFGPPLPRNPERSVALRKLLEAKDAAVRAVLTPTT